MQRLGAIFIAICMVVISASLGAILHLKFGLTIPEAAPFSVGILLTLMLVHYQISRVRDRLIIDEQMDDLTRLKLSLTRDVQDVRELGERLEHSLSERVQSEMGPILAELDLIGSLVRQLAESCAELDERVEKNEGAAKALKGKLEQATKTVAQLDELLRKKIKSRSLVQENTGAPDPAHKAGRSASQPAAQSAQMTGTPDSTPDSAAGEGVLPSQTVSANETAQEQAATGSAEEKKEAVAKALEAMANFHLADHRDDASEEEIATIRRALATGNLELHLQPVVTLPMRKPKYYEMLARLVAEDGSLVMPSSFLPVCKKLGFMPLLDRLSINKAFRLQRSLADRGHGVPSFCNVSVQSLADPDFFAHLRGLYEDNQDLIENIILEISQADFRSFSPMEEETVKLLSSMGFRFSVDQVTNLSLDFDAMARKGVRFAKVAAPILTHREAGRGMDIHPADFSRVLSRKGIELIVTHIETESVLVGLLDYNVQLAQGNHFAEAKPLRADNKPGSGASQAGSQPSTISPQDIPAPMVHGTGGRTADTMRASAPQRDGMVKRGAGHLARQAQPSKAPAQPLHPSPPVQTAGGSERTLGQNPRVAQALKALSDGDQGNSSTRDHFRSVLAEAAGLMEPETPRAAASAPSGTVPMSPQVRRVVR
ncbi:MAG: EAL domain-containing protein [Cohaesibacter sp.]|jgi:cyclic-di-GMP phosphodiesterase TipF (flagellum assembly factor)|nr:EAL domain-containing protein [Cohaesibacter sp.]